MRPRLRRILLVAIAISVATPALAARGDWWFGPQFGRSVPTGDFGMFLNSGFEAGLGGTFFESKQLGTGVEVAYHRWSGSLDSNAPLVALLGPGWEVKLNAIQTTAHVLFNLRTGAPDAKFFTFGVNLIWRMGAK